MQNHYDDIDEKNYFLLLKASAKQKFIYRTFIIVSSIFLFSFSYIFYKENLKKVNIKDLENKYEMLYNDNKLLKDSLNFLKVKLLNANNRP